MKNFLLINFFLFNFVFFIVPAVSWEVNNTSNLSESCINENLDPCSHPQIDSVFEGLINGKYVLKNSNLQVIACQFEQVQMN